MKTTKAFFLLLSLAPVVEAAYEWAGTFDLADNSHTWSMQADVNGDYPDPSMDLVFFVTADTSQSTIDANKAAGETLLTSDGCTVVQAGETIGPFDADNGSCYRLTVGVDPDSLFPMDTTDISGIVVFSQHHPIEFERDRHYLQDSAGVDIEPVVEEALDGGHDHDHDHDHDHAEHMTEESGQSCACAQSEYGFTIDCTDDQAMLDALAATKSNGCSADCTSDTCKKNYLILQSHHDYCPPDKVPHEVQDGFHDLDTKCTSCTISRQYDSNNPDCPTPNCDDQSGNDAHTRASEAGCLTDCSSDACHDDYLILRMVHDECPHDTLTGAAEDGLHDLEVPCIQHSCNQVSAEEDQLTCTDEAGGSSAASRKTVVVILYMIGVLAVFVSI